MARQRLVCNDMGSVLIDPILHPSAATSSDGKAWIRGVVARDSGSIASLEGRHQKQFAALAETHREGIVGAVAGLGKSRRAHVERAEGGCGGSHSQVTYNREAG